MRRSFRSRRMLLAPLDDDERDERQDGDDQQDRYRGHFGDAVGCERERD